MVAKRGDYYEYFGGQWLWYNGTLPCVVSAISHANLRGHKSTSGHFMAINVLLVKSTYIFYSILNTNGENHLSRYIKVQSTVMRHVLQWVKTSIYILAATKQLYKWYIPSARLSVCLSHLFLLCSHHCIIMKFSGIITNDQSKVHAKGEGQRSKVKVTEVTTQLNRFRIVTPVWIHIWWWNDAYSLMLLRIGALLFFKVIRHISRSHGSKNRRIWPKLAVSGL